LLAAKQQLVVANGSYFAGIETNLESIREFYPGFVMRLYHSYRSQDKLNLLCKLFCDNPDLDLCNAHDMGKCMAVYTCPILRTILCTISFKRWFAI
jgi:hypothetical protein